MAQKINPISLRLGLTQVWDSALQNYGKLSNNYSIVLHTQLQIHQFLVQFFNFNKLLLGETQFNSFSNKMLLNIFYSNLIQNSKLSEAVLIQNSKLILNWTVNKVLIRFYFKVRWFFMADLIFNYVQHLLKQNISFNRVFWSLCHTLETQLNSKKIMDSTYGPIEGKLKGFKICISGRFDNSRNQMAKSIKYKTGSLSLINLQSHTEYVNSEIHTKLGTCGLQFWLFYKID